MVNFTMFLRRHIDPDIAGAPLKQAIDSGKLGSFSVDKDYFTVVLSTANSAASPTLTSTGWYSHMCWW